VLMDLQSRLDIDSVCCVDEAFKKLSTGHYDVVVSDYEMPKKNGLEFLKELREAKNEIPFILFTGKGREEVAIKALNLGADGYHHKQGAPETVYGELTHIIVSSFEKRNAQKMLWESEERFKKLVTNSKDAIMLTQADGIILYLSPACKNVLGYEPNELIGKVPWIIHPDDLEKVQKVFQSALTSKVNETLEYRILTKQGETKWVNHAFSQIWENDKLKQIVSNLTDITERKKVEATLKNSEASLRSLIDSMDDLVFVLDRSGVFTSYHQTRREEQLFVSPEKFLGKHFRDVIPPSVADVYQAALNKMEASGKCQEIVYSMEMRSEKFWYSAKLSPFKDESGQKNSITVVVRDITESKKTEDTLRQERGMLESVTKNIGAGLVMISKDYKILWMNSFLRQLTGASENHHCYSSFNTCTSICPDCGPKKIFEGAQFDSREYCNQTNFNKDHPVWFELIATPIKDADGNVVAALELTINITEKKEVQKKMKENSDKIDLMNEKLRVVGSLTRHDVGNKLSAVTGYAYLLKKKYADQVDLVEGLSKMEQSVKETVKIFEFAKMYEQLGVEELSYIDVEEKLREASALFSGSLPNIIIECNGLRVLADSFLRQLFYNFIDNTRKYGKKTTTIRVYFEKTNQDCLKLIFEDDGVGIPLENKPSLFKEGFSTGGSTGFGLFLTKKMMDVYGWTITEEGEPGKGAKFVMTITKRNKNGEENYQIVK
jgi:PAS domain S-box-containing protein